MIAYQRTLEGGIKVATGNRIKDQLAAIMEEYPETQADEDLLAARWIVEYTRAGPELQLEYVCPEVFLKDIICAYRTADIRRRRQEMAADGSYPWPTDEAERRQARSRQGAPGGS